MMNILINYANEKYRKAQKLNSWTGKHIAKFDKVYEFSSEDIDSEYKKIHKKILEQKRGNGLWLWKPYFINKVLNECSEGDNIIYCDSGAFFVSNIRQIIKIIDFENFFVTDYPLLEVNFTKPECFFKMECDEERFKMTNQISATYMGFKSNLVTKKFVLEWLKLCENEELISPHSNMEIVEDERYSFVSHREDQSIFSLLCKKKGIKPHRDISQRGKMAYTYYNCNYPFVEPKHDDEYKTVVFSHKMPAFRLSKMPRYILLCIKMKMAYKKFIRRIGN